MSSLAARWGAHYTRYADDLAFSGDRRLATCATTFIGTVGAIAAEEGFSYSSGLSGHAGESWTYENLNAFLHSPRDFAPGTKMSFRGFAKPEDIANVVAYLRSLSGSPAPLPE